MYDNVQIIIDPGHGGRDLGAVSNCFIEKEITLRLAKELEKIINIYFSNVLLTRQDDEDINLLQRGLFISDMADQFLRNKKDAQTICFSLHFNKHNKINRGSEIIYSIYSDNLLAEAIKKSIVESEFPMKDCYSKESMVFPGNDYYAIHRYCGKAKTLIINCLYMDNDKDLEMLKENNFYEDFARTILNGVIQYLEKRHKSKDILQMVGKESELG